MAPPWKTSLHSPKHVASQFQDITHVALLPAAFCVADTVPAAGQCVRLNVTAHKYKYANNQQTYVSPELTLWCAVSQACPGDEEAAARCAQLHPM